MKPTNTVTGRKGLAANSSCKGNKEIRRDSKKSLHVVLEHVISRSRQYTSHALEQHDCCCKASNIYLL